MGYSGGVAAGNADQPHKRQGNPMSHHDHGHGHAEDESVCVKVGIIFICVTVALFAIAYLQ